MVDHPKKKCYELWRSQIEESYSFFPEDNESARKILEPDAVLEWTVEASSRTEAMTKHHKYLGFEPYKPMEEDS